MRALYSSLLSLLLVTTLVWGGCISCDQYFSFGNSHGCCNPNGHCKRTGPSQKSGSDRECKLIAFDKQKPIGVHFALPAVLADAVAPLVASPPALAQSRDAIPADTSPPDLQVLNSVFLV